MVRGENLLKRFVVWNSLIWTLFLNYIMITYNYFDFSQIFQIFKDLLVYIIRSNLGQSKPAFQKIWLLSTFLSIFIIKYREILEIWMKNFQRMAFLKAWSEVSNFLLDPVIDKIESDRIGIIELDRIIFPDTIQSNIPLMKFF